ncbi:P2Y purinoceptor 3-like [Amia ocellicauda]|uniref:P2Y purinoceptor 3-like n=1 Tax=Amia ocellicauda TaxID=2972642 RepID=UPI003464D009
MMLTPFNTTQCHSATIHFILPCLMGIFYAVGFLLNSLSLWVFGSHVKNWNCGTVLQFNLALTDIVLTPMVPFMVLYLQQDDWPYGQFLCQLKACLLSIQMYGSICFLTLISIHRYMTVVHRASKPCFADKSFIKRLCLGVWVGLLLQGLPFFVILKTSEIDNSTKCLSIHQSDMSVIYFSYNVAILLFGLIVPFSMCVVCYSCLSVFMSKVKICSLKGQMMKAKSTQVITVCLLIFTICYIPVHVTRTIGVTIKLFFPFHCGLLERTEVMYYISFTLSSINCCLDPLLYCFASKHFRESFQSFLTAARCPSPGSHCLKLLRNYDPNISVNTAESVQMN